MIIDIDVFSWVGSDDLTYAMSGGFSIKGYVKELNIELPCRVRLFEKSSGRLINEVKTNSDGYYEFNGLANVIFFILAHHPSGKYNAVIQDNMVPK